MRNFWFIFIFYVTENNAQFYDSVFVNSRFKKIEKKDIVKFIKAKEINSYNVLVKIDTFIHHYSAYFDGKRYVRNGQFYTTNIAEKLLYNGEFMEDSLVKLKTKNLFVSYRHNMLNGQFAHYSSEGYATALGLYKDNCKWLNWKEPYSLVNGTQQGNYCPRLEIIDLDSTKQYILIKNNKFEVVEKFKFNMYYVNEMKKIYKLFYFPYLIHFKQGIWSYYDSEGRLLRKEDYEDGFLKTSIEFH